MMKMKRKLLALTLVLALVLGLCLTGCSKQEAIAQPDEVAVALFDLLLKNDASAAKDALGYETEEAVRADFMGDSEEDFYGELADQLIGQFESMLGVTATEEDARMFLDSFMNMMGKLELTATVKEMDEKARTAVVTCSVNTIDATAFSSALETAMVDLVNNDPSLANDPDAMVSAIIRTLSDALDNMEPTEETSSFDVDFSLEVMETNGKPQRVWVPADAAAFGQAVSTAALGG